MSRSLTNTFIAILSVIVVYNVLDWIIPDIHPERIPAAEVERTISDAVRTHVRRIGSETAEQIIARATTAIPPHLKDTIKEDTGVLIVNTAAPGQTPVLEVTVWFRRIGWQSKLPFTDQQWEN